MFYISFHIQQRWGLGAISWQQFLPSLSASSSSLPRSSSSKRLSLQKPTLTSSTTPSHFVSLYQVRLSSRKAYSSHRIQIVIWICLWFWNSLAEKWSWINFHWAEVQHPISGGLQIVLFFIKPNKNISKYWCCLLCWCCQATNTSTANFHLFPGFATMLFLPFTVWLLGKNYEQVKKP